MERDKPEPGNLEGDYVHPDPAMDVALNWLFMLQAAPDDEVLRAKFETWRRAAPEHSQAFAEVADAWDLPEMDIVARDLALRTGHNARAQHTIVPECKRPKRNVWSKVVMAAAAVMVIGVGIQQYPALMLQWQADYMTATGARDEITLPDGSRMTLNTASAVALDFEGSKRSVTLLQGEAYFDVVPDYARPFTVAASFAEVEVKGTAFSVRTESDHDTIILDHGQVVAARLPERMDIASLESSDTITATATAFSAVTKTDPVMALAWREGRIIFEDQPFGRVLEEVGRYYDRSIIVANAQLNRVKINGNYRLDDPERTVRSLATAAGATVTRIPGGILILR